MHIRQIQTRVAQQTIKKTPLCIRLMRQSILVIFSVLIAWTAAEGDVVLDVDGRLITNDLTLLALDCAANANGGTLTTDASGQVICSDDDITPADSGACVAGGISGTVVSGFDADGTFLRSCFRRDVTTWAGSGTQGFTNGIGDVTKFNYPYGVAVDEVGTVVYVEDKGNHRIRRIR